MILNTPHPKKAGPHLPLGMGEEDGSEGDATKQVEKKLTKNNISEALP